MKDLSVFGLRIPGIFMKLYRKMALDDMVGLSILSGERTEDDT